MEIRKADGTEVDVTLDKDLKVVGQDTEADDDRGRRRRRRSDDANEAPDADDRALSATERSSAEQGRDRTRSAAAPSPTSRPATTAAWPTRSRSAQADGTEWDVDLDSAFAVVHK